MFNYFDVITLLIVLAACFFGFQTGIIASLFYVASGFIGMFVARTFSPGPGMKFYLFFAAGAGGAILIGFIISRILKKIFLGTLDRLSGAVLGLLFGVVLISILLLPLSGSLRGEMRKAVLSSCSGSHILPLSRKMFPQFEEFCNGRIEQIEEILPQIKELPEKIIRLKNKK